MKNSQAKIFNIAATTICLICSIPQQGMCDVVAIDQLAAKLATFEYSPPLPTLSIGFIPQASMESLLTDLVDTICASKKPLKTTREFMTAFLNLINSQNGTHHSIEDMCHAVRQNLHLIPKEYHEIVLLAAESIETNTLPSDRQIQNAAAILGPSMWITEWLFSKTSSKKKVIAAKISEWFVFAVIAVVITTVAIKKPEAVTSAGNVMIDAGRMILGK